MSMQIRVILFSLCGFGMAVAPLDRVAGETPALPQPDVVFYGTVACVPGNSPVIPTTVVWSVAGNGESITASNTTIIVVNGGTFYLTRVPFEVRQITGGPAFAATANALALTRADTTYTRSATVGIDSATRAAIVPAGKETFVYGATRQGLAERIDLTVGETFAEWSQRIFGSVVDPNADADGDGHTNRQEYLQGTDPQSAQSFSIVRSFTPAPGGGFTIRWDSLPARSYTVERSATLGNGGWQAVGPPLSGTGGPLEYTHPASAETRLFFRIVVSGSGPEP